MIKSLSVIPDQKIQIFSSCGLWYFLQVLNFVNYNEIPAALENFNKNGRAFKIESSKVFTDHSKGYYYYKFKALKPSYNEITLKFNYIDSSFWKVENTTKYIKVNILAKK